MCRDPDPTFTETNIPWLNRGHPRRQAERISIGYQEYTKKTAMPVSLSSGPTTGMAESE